MTDVPPPGAVTPDAAAHAADGAVSTEGRRSLERNGLALILNTASNAAFGGLFWLVAARLYAPAQLGQDSALISAMLLLAAVAGLNVGNGLPRFLPQLGSRSTRWVSLSYLGTAGLSLVLGLGFVFVAPLFSDSLQFLRASWPLATLFVLAVMSWNIFSLQDSVLAALRRAWVILFENTVFGFSKLALMAIFAWVAFGHGVFYSWLVPMVLLLIPVNYVLFRNALPRHVKNAKDVESSILSHEGANRKVMRFLAMDYAGFVLMQASIMVLPLIVVAELGKAQNAFFYIAFTVATTVGQMGEAVGLQLTVEGAFDERGLANLTRHTVKRFAMVLLPAAAFVVIAAPWLLLVFGQEYSDNATELLRLLGVGSIPCAVLSIYQAVARVRGEAGRVLITQFGRAVLVLGFVVALIHRDGLTSVGWAWSSAHAVLAIAVLPEMISVMRIRSKQTPS